jgi:hypothetical protein
MIGSNFDGVQCAFDLDRQIAQGLGLVLGVIGLCRATGPRTP